MVHVLDTGGDAPARAAFAVSRAVGNSVVRHGVVRRLRPLMPPILDDLAPGTQVVVRAMPEAAAASSAELNADLTRAMARVAPAAPATGGRIGRGDAVDDRSHGLRQVLGLIGWPIRALLLGLIWTYRHTVSPMLPPTCRYHPSCSAYGFEALTVHGAAKGSVLAVWRVLRCNPFTPGGLDPVPRPGHWRPDIHPDGTPRVASGGAS